MNAVLRNHPGLVAQDMSYLAGLAVANELAELLGCA